MRARRKRGKGRKLTRECHPRVTTAVSPLLASRLDIVARELGELGTNTCTKARLDIGLHTSLAEKREVFDLALKSWLHSIHEVVLRELQHAVAEIRRTSPSLHPLGLFRAAEEQVSLAIARGLGFRPRYEDLTEQRKDETVLMARLRRLGVAKPPSTDTSAEDLDLKWLRLYSSDWVKLACDDPRNDVWAFFQWRAPVWTLAEADEPNSDAGDNPNQRATPEQTETLLNDVAGQLRACLGNARFEAFQLVREERKPEPRRFREPAREAIARLRASHPDVQSAKEIALVLDKDRVPLPMKWLKFAPPEERTWSRALNHLNYGRQIRVMLSQGKPSHKPRPKTPSR